MSQTTVAPPKPQFWAKGDWAAYFGLLVNNLTNLLTMVSLLTLVVGLPVDMVLGRIAPAFGLAVFVASVWYTFLGYQMYKRTGRKDITVLPSGPSAPSIFTVTFLVLLPVYQTTKNAELALAIGLVWCLVEASILVVGSFVGDWLRRVIPRSVLLSCLAGLGLLLLAMNPMLQSFHTPVVAFVVLVLIFMNWFGRKPLFAKIPTGLLILLVGTGLAWLSGMMSPEAITVALAEAGFQPPTLHVSNIVEGIPMSLPFLASAVPLGLANYVFDLENIESAHAAGDPYPTRSVMLGNGITSAIGACFGNPFPVTVYIGHVGWKQLGARMGYSVASGFTMLIFGIFSLGAVLLSIIPMAAVAPILVYIGIVSANQVVRETPRNEVPVIFVALFPWIANWALTLIGKRAQGRRHERRRGGRRRAPGRRRRLARAEPSRQRRTAGFDPLGLHSHLRDPQPEHPRRRDRGDLGGPVRVRHHPLRDGRLAHGRHRRRRAGISACRRGVRPQVRHRR